MGIGELCCSSNGFSSFERNKLKFIHIYKILAIILIGNVSVSCEQENAPTTNESKENFRVSVNEGMVAYIYGEYEKAEKLFRGYKLFRYGNPAPPALYNLGVMFERGEGVKRDYRKAFEFYEDAAHQGITQAMYNLAVFYEWGLGTDLNSDLQKQQRIYWLEKAAEKGLPQAESELASLIWIEDILNESSRERASKLRQKSKDKGLTIGTDFTLGIISWAADDYQKILPVYELLAQQGKWEAQFQLGSIYFNGEAVLFGFPQNQREGSYWLIKAAQNGHIEAQFRVGLIYQFGCHSCKIPQDRAEAASWFLKAAEMNHPLAQFWLAHAYKDGDGTIVDQVAAYKWFNLSSAGGVSAGKYWVEELSKNLTSSQIQEAQRLTREWLEEHSGKN